MPTTDKKLADIAFLEDFLVVMLITAVAAELPYRVLDAPFTISIVSIVLRSNKRKSNSLLTNDGSLTCIPSIKTNTCLLFPPRTK